MSEAPYRALALVALAACYCCGGGSSSGHPSAGSSPQEVLVDQAGGSLCVPCTQSRPVTIARAGVLSVEVNWTYAANWITVQITPSPCDAEMLASRTCSILAWSQGRPTVASSSIRLIDAKPGTYLVVVHNIGPSAESYQYQVTLTPTP